MVHSLEWFPFGGDLGTLSWKDLLGMRTEDMLVGLLGFTQQEVESKWAMTMAGFTPENQTLGKKVGGEDDSSL